MNTYFQSLPSKRCADDERFLLYTRSKNCRLEYEIVETNTCCLEEPYLLDRETLLNFLSIALITAYEEMPDTFKNCDWCLVRRNEIA